MRKRCFSPKIEFSTSYLIMALGFVLTGHYLNLIVFTSLILMHELGHFISAKILNFNVDKIIIYPFGGITKLNYIINRDIREELLVATSGVIMQYIFYLLIIYLYKMGIIIEYTFNLYTIYNNYMIYFNLLPIYPLDGGKILNLILSIYFPYNKANIFTIYISLFVILGIFFLSIYNYSYSNIMIMIILLTYLYKFFMERKYLYSRLLLERYLYNIEYNSIKVIRNIKNIYKNRTHIININNIYIKEKKYLSILFKK